MMDWPPLRASAWLAGPAENVDQPDLIIALVQDLLQLLHGYRISTILTEEPREYRLTESAFRQLATAVGDRRVGFISLINDTPELPAGKAPADIDHRDVQGDSGAQATIWLPSESEFTEAPFLVEVDTWTRSGEAQVLDAQRFASFVQRWVEPLQAAAAFVSADPHDTASRTHYETIHRLPAARTWSEVQQYVRGAFWCNLLGATQCDRLGGRERVLADAPAQIKEPVGDGIWLQLSETPQTGSGVDEQMMTFLAPLLPHPGADVRSPRTVSSPPMPPKVQSPPASALPVPITVLDPSGDDLTLNVYIRAPLTAATKEAVAAAVDAWFRAGFDGAYQGTRFHYLSSPTVDEREAVMRWHIDLLSAHWQRVILDLARWLGAIPDVTVRRLVIGTETVE